MAELDSKHAHTRLRDSLRKSDSYRGSVWRPSPRATLHAARRYSIFVKFMKGALPLAALALGLAVLAYVLQPRDTGHMALTFERLQQLKDDRAMVKPRLSGTDDDGMPFVITAASAMQQASGSGLVQLTDVAADFTQKNGNAIHVIAAQGTVDTQKHLFDMAGGIKLTSSDGYDVRTEMANADLKAGTVHGEKSIEVESKFGRISADRFAFNRETKKVQFHGHVRMFLYRASK